MQSINQVNTPVTPVLRKPEFKLESIPFGPVESYQSSNAFYDSKGATMNFKTLDDSTSFGLSSHEHRHGQMPAQPGCEELRSALAEASPPLQDGSNGKQRIAYDGYFLS